MTPQSQDWRERFSQKFNTWHIATGAEAQEFGSFEVYEHIQDFIAKELAVSKHDLLTQVLAQMPSRREPTLCGKCNPAGKLCKECYANRRANRALEEVEATITRIIQKV